MNIRYEDRKPFKTYTVKHPAHGEFRAERVRDRLGAVIAAALEWKVQWSAIARECEFSEVRGSAGEDSSLLRSSE